MSVILWYYRAYMSWVNWAYEPRKDGTRHHGYYFGQAVSLTFLFVIPGGVGAACWALLQVVGVSIPFEQAIVAPVLVVIAYAVSIIAVKTFIWIVKTAIGSPRK